KEGVRVRLRAENQPADFREADGASPVSRFPAEFEQDRETGCITAVEQGFLFCPEPVGETGRPAGADGQPESPFRKSGRDAQSAQQQDGILPVAWKEAPRSCAVLLGLRDCLGKQVSVHFLHHPFRVLENVNPRGSSSLASECPPWIQSAPCRLRLSSTVRPSRALIAKAVFSHSSCCGGWGSVRGPVVPAAPVVTRGVPGAGPVGRSR